MILFLSACIDSNSTFNKIDVMFKKNEFQDILKLYFENKDEFNNDSQLLNKIGLTYHELKEYNKAIEFYNNAIRIDKNISVFYSNKGLSEIEINEYINATISCKKATDLDTKNYGGYLNRGYAFIKLEKWEWALDELNKAVSIKDVNDKDLGIGYANLSTVYLNIGNEKKALEFTNKSILLNKEISWAYKNRAFIRMKEQKIDEALIDINKGLRLKPEDEILIYYKGLILTKTSDIIKGCELMKKSLALINKGNIERINFVKLQIDKYCK